MTIRTTLSESLFPLSSLPFAILSLTFLFLLPRRNWSTKKKIFIGGQIALLTASVYMGSAIYTPGEQSVVAQFGVSQTASILGLTLFIGESLLRFPLVRTLAHSILSSGSWLRYRSKYVPILRLSSRVLFSDLFSVFSALVTSSRDSSTRS